MVSVVCYHANLKYFKSRFVTKFSKLKLYRTVIKPIVTYASETERNRNSETNSLWEENSKMNIWAHTGKSDMESQNQWRIRQADKT
jgi:hypothetical protein